MSSLMTDMKVGSNRSYLFDLYEIDIYVCCVLHYLWGKCCSETALPDYRVLF